jgi:hypothetical protein
MGLPDNQLDSLIETALQQGGNISPQQKQLAWERLSQKAMGQSVLPPLPAWDKRVRDRLFEVGGGFWQWFSNFAIEEDRYERARINRYMMRYHGMRHTGELAMQFLEPLRMMV